MSRLDVVPFKQMSGEIAARVVSPIDGAKDHSEF